MRWRLVCGIAVALLVVAAPLAPVFGAWTTSHDFGAGFIVTGMFTYRGQLYAMVHSYAGAGKAQFYRVTNVNADNTTAWELVWSTDSEYAELEHVVILDWVPFYCVDKRIYYVSTGNNGEPNGFLDQELSVYVADLAVHGDYIYAVTVIGSVWRSAGYGDWSPVGVAYGYGSFDWSLASFGDYLYASSPAGIWRSTDGTSFTKVCSGSIRELGVHSGGLWAYATNGSLYNSSSGTAYSFRGTVAYPVKDFCSFGDDLYIATAAAVSGRVYKYSGGVLSTSDSLSNGAWCLYQWGANLYSGWGVANAAPHGLVRVMAGYSGSPLDFVRINVVPAGPTAATIWFDTTHASNYTLYYWKAFPASSQTSALFRGSHTAILTGLQEDSQYFYNITCKDAAGRRVDSGTLTFNTSAKNELYIPAGGFGPYTNFTDDYETVLKNSDLHNYSLSVTGDSDVVVSALFAHGGVNSTRLYDNHSNTPDSAVGTRPLGGFAINGSLQSWIYLNLVAPEPWPYRSGVRGFWIELWEATTYPYSNPSHLVGRVRAAWYGIGQYGFFNSTDDFMQNAVANTWHNITFWWRAADPQYYIYINGNPYAVEWDEAPVKGVTHIIFRLNSLNMPGSEIDFREAVYLDDIKMAAWDYENITLTGSGSGVFDRIFSMEGEVFAALNNGTHGTLYRYNGSEWNVTQPTYNQTGVIFNARNWTTANAVGLTVKYSSPRENVTVRYGVGGALNKAKSWIKLNLSDTFYLVITDLKPGTTYNYSFDDAAVYPASASGYFTTLAGVVSDMAYAYDNSSWPIETMNMHMTKNATNISNPYGQHWQSNVGGNFFWTYTDGATPDLGCGGMGDIYIQERLGIIDYDADGKLKVDSDVYTGSYENTPSEWSCAVRIRNSSGDNQLHWYIHNWTGAAWVWQVVPGLNPVFDHWYNITFIIDNDALFDVQGPNNYYHVRIDDSALLGPYYVDANWCLEPGWADWYILSYLLPGVDLDAYFAADLVLHQNSSFVSCDRVFNGSLWDVVRVFPGEIGDCAYDAVSDAAYLITSNRTHVSGVGGSIWKSTDFQNWDVVLNLSSFDQVNDGVWDGFELTGEGTGADRWTDTTGVALAADFEYPVGAMNVTEGQSCFILDDDPADWVYAQIDPGFSVLGGDTGYYQVFFFLGSPDGSYLNFSLLNNSDFWIYVNSTAPGANSIVSWNGTLLDWIPPIDAFGMTEYWHNLTVNYSQMGMRVKVWLDGVLIDDGPTRGVMWAPMGFGTWRNDASGSAMFDDYKEQDAPFGNPIRDCTYAVSVDVCEGFLLATFSNTPWNPTRQGGAAFLYNRTVDEWNLVYSGDPFTKVIAADGNFWAGFSCGIATPSGNNESFIVNLTPARLFFDDVAWRYSYSPSRGQFMGLSPSFTYHLPGATSYVADMVSLASKFHGTSQYLPWAIIDPCSVRSWALVLNSSGGYMFGNFTNTTFASLFSLPDHFAPGNDEDRIGGDRLSVDGLDLFVATGSGVWRVYEGLSDLASWPVVLANNSADGLWALEWRGADLFIGTVRNVTFWPARWILFPIYATGNNATAKALVSVDGYCSQVVNISTGAPYPHDSYYFFDAAALGDTFLDRRYVCLQFVSHPGLWVGVWNKDVYLDALTMWAERYYWFDGSLNYTCVYLAFYASYDQNCTFIPFILRGVNTLSPNDNASLAFYMGMVNLSSTGWHVLSFILDNGTSEEFARGPGLSVAPSYWSHGNNVGLPMNESLSFIDHRVMIVVDEVFMTHFWFDARALGFYNYTNNYSWFRVDIRANASAAATFCADKVILRVNESGWYLDIWEGHSYLIAPEFPWRDYLWPHPYFGGDEYGVPRPKHFNWSLFFDEDLDPTTSTKFGSSWFTTSSLAWRSAGTGIPVVWPGLSANLTILLGGRLPGGFLAVFEGNVTANCRTNSTNISLDVYNATDGSWLVNVVNGTFNFTAGILYNLTTLFGYPVGSEPNWTAPGFGNYYGNLSVWDGIPNLNLSFDTWLFTFGAPPPVDPLNVSLPWIRDRDNGPFYTDDSLGGMLVAARVVSVNAVIVLQVGYRCRTLNENHWMSASFVWAGNGTYYYIFSLPAQIHKGDVVDVYAYAVDVVANSELRNASYTIDWVRHEIATPYGGSVEVFHEATYSNGRFTQYPGSISSYKITPYASQALTTQPPAAGATTTTAVASVSSADFRQEGPGGYGRIRVVPPKNLYVIGVNYDGIFYSLLAGSMSIGEAVFDYDGRDVDIRIPLSHHDVGVVFGFGGAGGIGGPVPGAGVPVVLPPGWEWDVYPGGPFRFPFGQEVESTSEGQRWQKFYVAMWVVAALAFAVMLLLLLVLLLWGLTCWLTIFGLIVLSLIAALLIQIVPYSWILILLFVSSIFFVLTRKSCKKIVCKVRYDDTPAYRRCVERAKRAYWAVMPFFGQVAVQAAQKLYYANYTYAIGGLLGAYGLVMLPFMGYNYFGWRTEMPI